MTTPSITSVRLSREAKALRDNLKRRKDQAKARQAQKDSGPASPKPQKDCPQ